MAGVMIWWHLSNEQSHPELDPPLRPYSSDHGELEEYRGFACSSGLVSLLLSLGSYFINDVAKGRAIDTEGVSRIAVILEHIQLIDAQFVAAKVERTEWDFFVRMFREYANRGAEIFNIADHMSEDLTP